MIIKEIWEIDDVEYTCQVFNSMRYTSINCRAKVGPLPRIECIPSELCLPEDNNTKIKEKWSGDMPFTVISTEMALSLLKTPGPIDPV